MPTFAIYTNLPKDKIPGSFILDASSFIAKRLGKPESYVTVRVHPDQMMSHGGSTDPCGSVELYSIGALGEKNKEHAKEIADFIEKTLGIAQDRFYVTFVDLERGNVGLNGKTFAQ
ncbi:macrophage migration inhibitory factor-like [Mytilus californianus]|uniref:macrophage migration inhibitory factor-like n=1 Tax=Mytilus californianus TaxID=6549 RepID=UPI002246C92E|nr:macrophage migration inhibitory factor-like [Mytilus californianus]